MELDFQALADAVMWSALYKKFKHRMPVLIVPSQTAIDWMRKNISFADLATEIYGKER